MRRVKHAVWLCLVVMRVIEINFITLITPIHHHPCSANPYRPTPIGDSALRAAKPSSGSPPAAWWESSTE